jgi:hypothetical protein
VSNDTILYTILQEDLVKVWTTTAPTQGLNGSYEYDVTANIDHYTLYEGEYINKISNAVTKTFTSDILPLTSVVALNAWVAAANVAGSGHRTVENFPKMIFTAAESRTVFTRIWMRWMLAEMP